MGQVYSQKSCNSTTENIKISSSTPEALLLFDPSESHLVSYGVDRQTSGAFQKPANPGAALSSEVLRQALADSNVTAALNTALYRASDYNGCCGFAHMKATFQEQAMKVGKSGIFFFHFSGHGVTNGYNEWVLAPADFDRTQETYITAETLTEWLSEIQCEAKYIIFTLDCCYSGGVAEELTVSNWAQTNTQLYIITACTALEVTTTLGTLEHSIFSHFLAVALKSQSRVFGQLSIEETFGKCQICSMALSSLLLRYSCTEGLKCKVSRPQMRVIDLQSTVKEMLGEGDEQTDSRVEPTLQYVLDLYDHTWTKCKLNKKTVSWLESLASPVDGALVTLKDNQVLSGDVLLTVFCSVMFSTASLELAYNFNKIGNPNLSLHAFLSVAALLKRMLGRVEITKTQFRLGWLFYRKALKGEGLERGLAAIHKELSTDPSFNEPLTAMGE